MAFWQNEAPRSINPIAISDAPSRDRNTARAAGISMAYRRNCDARVTDGGPSPPMRDSSWEDFECQLEGDIATMRAQAVVDAGGPSASKLRAERTPVFHYAEVKDASVKSEPVEMQNNRRAKRSDPVHFTWRLRRRALALLVAAVAVASSFAPSARAQNGAAPPAAPAAAEPASPPAAAAPASPPPAAEASPSAPANAVAPAATEQPVGQTSVSRTQLPQDLSPWGMFQDADRLVKGGPDRARHCFARDLDGLYRQDIRTAHRAPRSARRASHPCRRGDARPGA